MLLMATVDDVTGEVMPYVIDRLIEAGASNVHVMSAMTKKGRTEYIILVDVEETKLDAACSVLALELGTLGFKVLESRHMMFSFTIDKKEVHVCIRGHEVGMPVRVKYLKKDDAVISLKAEYEDIKALAKRLSFEGKPMGLAKLKTMIEAEALKSMFKGSDIEVILS